MLKIIRKYLRHIKARYYRIRHKNQFRQHLREHQKRIRQKYCRKEKINILFFIQFPEMWNSLKTVYDAARKNDSFNVFLIAIPKRGVCSQKAFCKINEAYDFAITNALNPIEGIKNDKWIDLKVFQPDYIFVQRPYDSHMPDEYSMRKLSELAIICYVPYSGRLTKGIHVQTEFNNTFLESVSYIFADCDESYRYVQEHKKNKQTKIFNIGFPRFDLIKQSDNSCINIKRVLWTPRWSISEKNNRSFFKDYFDSLMTYFEKNKELYLTIRPHPLMFTNFLTTGYMTEEEVRRIKERVNAASNIEFDSNEDYLLSFQNSDMIVSDITSLLLEYFFTGKPIVLFDKLNDPTDMAKDIGSTFYFVNNNIELEKILNNLTSRNDPFSDKRKQILCKYNTAYKTNVGEKIISILAGENK